MHALIKERGRPILVATPYLPQRYLIGPALFPVYWFVLKIVLFCYLLPATALRIGAAIIMRSHGVDHAAMNPVGDLWSWLWWNVIVTGFAVTAIFALLEDRMVRRFRFH